MLNKKRRNKLITPAGTSKTGTAAYKPMYKVSQIKDAGSIRSNNQALYHMFDNGGPAKLTPRKKGGGSCGCKGGKIGNFSGILYKKK